MEGDVAWVLTSAALVLFMVPGLALFYGGMVRAKNALNMLNMNMYMNMCMSMCGHRCERVAVRCHQVSPRSLAVASRGPCARTSARSGPYHKCTLGTISQV